MKRVSLSLFTLILTFLVCDVGLRLLSFPYYRPHEKYIERWPSMPLVERYLPLSRCKMQSHGDLAAMSGDRSARCTRHIDFFTDEHGFLNAPSSDWPEEDVEILLLGDSFAAGSGVSCTNAVSALLRSRHGLHTYNLAIPGASPWSQMANLMIEMPRLKRRLSKQALAVLLFFPGNDLDEECRPSFDVREFPWQSRRLQVIRRAKTIMAKDPVVASIRRIMHSRQLFYNPLSTAGSIMVRKYHDVRMLFYEPYLRIASRTKNEILSNINEHCVEGVLSAMKDVCEANGVEFIVCMIPSKECVYLDGGCSGKVLGPTAEAFSDILARLGICFYDLTGPMTAHAESVFKNEKKLLWWPDDSHWNVHGHEWVAEYLSLVVGEGIPPDNAVRRRYTQSRGSE